MIVDSVLYLHTVEDIRKTVAKSIAKSRHTAILFHIHYCQRHCNTFSDYFYYYCNTFYEAASQCVDAAYYYRLSIGWSDGLSVTVQL